MLSFCIVSSTPNLSLTWASRWGWFFLKTNLTIRNGGTESQSSTQSNLLTNFFVLRFNILLSFLNILLLYGNQRPHRKRGIYLLNGGGNLCSFCNDHLEATHHLFSTCTFTYHIWQSMYKWLDISSALPLNPFNNYLSHLGMAKDKKGQNVWRIIWLATIWAIWLHMNDIIFNHIRLSSLHLLDSARVNA
ncbi:hypothetical protein Lal_00018456 [Lupinus albus]|nr:hypothetical protein Lal_00018456 [Lupinus albus]